MNADGHVARGADRAIVVVTGLPRSGTSMLMRMLGAGGMPLLTDGLRPPDAHNPHGYFEYSPVKRLKEDAAWVASSAGRAVKIVSYLLPALPPGLTYHVLLIRRPLPEVLASQRAMLGEALGDDAALASLFERDLARAEDWIARHAERSLALEHRAILDNPREIAEQIVAFLGRPFDIERMSAAVDLSLRRQRVSL